jgi:hypothetical protein
MDLRNFWTGEGQKENNMDKSRAMKMRFERGRGKKAPSIIMTL